MKTKIFLFSALLISCSNISAKIGNKMPKRTLTYVTIGAIQAQNSLREERLLAKDIIRQDKWLNQMRSSMLAQDDEFARQEQLLLSELDAMRVFESAFTISTLDDDENKQKQRECVRKEKKEPIIKDTDKDPSTKDKEKEVEKKKQDSSK